MEYKLECPGFFLRTETCTGPVNRFDAAALAPERQTLALEGLRWRHLSGCLAFWQTS